MIPDQPFLMQCLDLATYVRQTLFPEEPAGYVYSRQGQPAVFKIEEPHRDNFKSAITGSYGIGTFRKPRISSRLS